MNIVAPGDSFDLNFIAKCDLAVLTGGVITNTNLNKDTVLTKGSNVEYYDNDYYYGATITAEVKEGEFYDILFTDIDGNEAYRGKVFVTAQENYTINNGKYVQRDSDNEYLTR